MASTVQPEFQQELIPADDKNWRKPDALAPLTPLSLMQIALERGQVDQLQVLQDMHFRQQAKDAEDSFNRAMNAAQSTMERIIATTPNTQTGTKYATYTKLDSVLRPIYIKHGFSLSFDCGESPVPDCVRAYCYVSHVDGHTRKYQSPDMPLPIQGPKGNAVMTKTHGTGAAMSYAMRYLLKYIFNVAIGQEDTDGNQPQMSEEETNRLQEWLDHIAASANFEELESNFREAYSKYKDQKSRDAIVYSKNTRKAQLRGGK